MTNLYSTHAKEFSATRQAPWPGWDRALNVVRNTLYVSNQTYNAQLKTLNVIDLGCGNGRFLRYLMNNEQLMINSYVGVDSSEELLKIANDEFRNQKLEKDILFFNLDLENPDWIRVFTKDYKLPTKNYQLITAFGLMHHIHTFEQRKNIYSSAFELLSPGGVFCVTFWQFLKRKKIENRLKKLENNDDYTLTFGNYGATRFVHYTDDDEIKKLEAGIQLEIIDEYYSDGKEGNLNLYKIYRRNE